MQSTLSCGTLTGLRVIDASHQPGRSQAGAWLAEQGARVVAIAPPRDNEAGGEPDDERDQQRAQPSAPPQAQRLHLDLDQPSGRDMLLHLLADADVLIENFAPGTLDRWGLGQALLLRRFPGLLHCRLGRGGGPPDQQALLQALRERRHGGGGGFVDIGLQSFGIPTLRPRQAGAGVPPQMAIHASHAQAMLAGIDGQAMLATATEPVLLALGDNRQFALLCQHLGVPAWPLDPRFASASARARHRAELQALLEQRLAWHDGAMLADALAALGVRCAPVLGVPECWPAHWPGSAATTTRQVRWLAAHRLPALTDAEHYLPLGDAADTGDGGASRAG